MKTASTTQPEEPLRDVRWRIGGLGVHVTSADPALGLVLPPAVLPFVDEAGGADATVRARWGDVATAPAGAPLFDSGGVWTLSRQAGDLLFHFRSPTFGPVPYKVARFRGDFTAGEVVIHRPYFDTSVPVYPLEYPLDELLCVSLLARRDGVELHGCGIVDRGAGLLFVGPSGAGKSTMARLWKTHPGATVLSDDRIIVRREGRDLVMHGTPWHGDEPAISAGRVKLARVFVLRQSPDCAVRPLETSTAVAHLFSCCFPAFYSREALAETLRILEIVAQQTPCAELSFRRDAATIHHVRSIA
jgi:hypothetical protein